MTISLMELQARVARNTGGYIESATTTVGSSTTDVNDTQLANHTPSPNTFRTRWFQARSAQNAGEVRRITASSTSDLTIVAMPVAMPTGTRYAIYTHSPTDITAAINAAIRDAGNALYEHVIDESIIIDDLGTNSSFENSRMGLRFDGGTEVVTIAAQTKVDDLFTGGGTLVLEFEPHVSDGDVMICKEVSGFTTGKPSGSKRKV